MVLLSSLVCIAPRAPGCYKLETDAEILNERNAVFIHPEVWTKLDVSLPDKVSILGVEPESAGKQAAL